jgi:hypothetical protein
LIVLSFRPAGEILSSGSMAGDLRFLAELGMTR